MSRHAKLDSQPIAATRCKYERPFGLRGLVLVCLALGCLVAGWSVGEEQEAGFPFKAFVARDRTLVRCGPGDEHYATDELPRGSEVEVYRRAEGGWLAIRPPKSSFSWVAQRDIEQSEGEDSARVVGTSAVSWIGSAVEEVADHRWLVKLDRGEPLVVLGQERRQMVSAGKSDVYCKIVPPSGEFRWLHEDDLVDDAAAADGSVKDPEVALADFRVSLRGKPRPVAVAEPQEPAETPRTAARTPVRAQPAPPVEPAAPADSAATRKDDFMPRGSETRSVGSIRQQTQPTQPTRSTTRDRSTAPATRNTSPALATTAGLESQLRELEAALSLTVAQPAQNWDLETLRQSAEQLVVDGKSTLERARVQLYLDKLAEFEQLKSRHALLSPKTPSLISSIRSKLTGEPESPEAGLDPRFDGTGWLLPVHSSKTNSPPYALLDSDGNILQFVSPAPGLNLNRYVRKEIGVFGQRDQASTLDKPHLTAQRIVELDRHRK